MRWGELRYCLIELGHMKEDLPIPLGLPGGPAPIVIDKRNQVRKIAGRKKNTRK